MIKGVAKVKKEKGILYRAPYREGKERCPNTRHPLPLLHPSTVPRLFKEMFPALAIFPAMEVMG